MLPGTTKDHILTPTNPPTPVRRVSDLQLRVCGDVFVADVEHLNDLLDTLTHVSPHAHSVISVVVVR